MTPFPDWARWMWAVFFALTVFEHLPHLRHMRGAHRLWHLGHIVMAVGMAWMFIPPEYRDTTRWPWQVLYALTTTIALGYAAARITQGVRIDLSWIALTVGQTGMWYMWAMRDGIARELVTYAAAAWFAAEAVGWFTGELRARRDSSFLPKALGPLRTGPAGSDATLYLAGAKPLAYGVSWVGCVSLGLMAVGMAYMLVGMQIELCQAGANCRP